MITFSAQFPAGLHVGTSSWSSPDWRGSFYPEGIEPADMISAYARQLSTVEIDSTWYRIPGKSMVDAWHQRTPPGFIFSAKVPSIISHEKYLLDCEPYVYFNNHYAGYAPGSVELFSHLWNRTD